MQSIINKISAFAGAAALVALVLPAGAQVSSDDATRYPKRDAAAKPVGEKAVRASFTVEPGQSVQEAVDRARPGDLIEVKPGIYHESVTIDFDDIEFAGVIVNGERPVFDGQDKLNDAIMVSGNNFTIRNIEMRNYLGNGVVVNQAKNATFINVVADKTGKYGVYPVLCDGVLVDGCKVTNVWDAGIYAGQCKNVTLQNNVSTRNTIGLETENCVNVLMANNTAFNNSLGLLVVLLPDLPTKLAQNARVINNHVFDNNYPNLAPPGQLVSGVEPGSGINVAAADTTEVTKNIIEGNNTFGVIVSAATDFFPPEHKLDIEPNPDGNHIHGNKYAKNGSGPVGPRYAKAGMTKGADIYWSGKGKGNGFSETTKASIPAELPAWTGGIAGGGGGGK